MKLLVIGSTGFVGGSLARHCVSGGHRVQGSARSEDAAARLAAAGVEPVLGDFGGRRADLLAAAARADAVVFAAQLAPDSEVDAVRSTLDAVAGSGATFVSTSGSGVLLQRTGGAWSPDSFAEAVIAGASSRLRAPRSRDELGWAPRHPDMLASVGDERLRRLADPTVGS